MKITIDVSAGLLRDIDKRATERRTTRERAAAELLRAGARMTTDRFQRSIDTALAVMQRVRSRGAISYARGQKLRSS